MKSRGVAKALGANGFDASQESPRADESESLREKLSGPASKHVAGKGRSEFDLIARLRRIAATAQPRLVIGIGDDAALVRERTGQTLAITADMLVEEIDFRRQWTTARDLGHKALAVSLSDIAAMGARPRWALISLGVPQEIWRTDFLDDFYRGWFALARASGVALIGGDISRTPERIVIDSVVLGETRRAIMRSGARPGDLLFVTGALGGAAAGLHLLMTNGVEEAHENASFRPRRTSRADRRLIRRHLRPEPRLAWGNYLTEKKLATAMIDLSDGLSSDLAHLCRESGVGAIINAEAIPIDPLIAKSSLRGEDPLRLALDGGEDFELLFTVRPRDVRRLPRELDGVRAVCIGEVTARRRLVLVRDGRTLPLRPGGFVHFHSR